MAEVTQYTGRLNNIDWNDVLEAMKKCQDSVHGEWQLPEDKKAEEIDAAEVFEALLKFPLQAEKIEAEYIFLFYRTAWSRELKKAIKAGVQAGTNFATVGKKFKIQELPDLGPMSVKILCYGTLVPKNAQLALPAANTTTELAAPSASGNNENGEREQGEIFAQLKALVPHADKKKEETKQVVERTSRELVDLYGTERKMREKYDFRGKPTLFTVKGSGRGMTVPPKLVVAWEEALRDLACDESYARLCALRTDFAAYGAKPDIPQEFEKAKFKSQEAALREVQEAEEAAAAQVATEKAAAVTPKSKKRFWQQKGEVH
jgi:hypothetical protein